MPTFNQLIHTGRAVSEKKAKAPALLKVGTPRSALRSIRIPRKSVVFARLLRRYPEEAEFRTS